MNINDTYPSKYLKADADIPEDGDLVLTMDTVEVETLGQGSDTEEKPVLYFLDCPKGLALNRTNASTISNMYGPETADWHGRKIALFATEVDFKGKQTLAIRVRMRKPQSQQAAPSRQMPAAQATGGRGGRSASAPEEEQADPFLDE